MADAEILIHAFVSFRLDYCNILSCGMPCTSTKSLQMIQIAAARILTKTRKFDHIASILASFHTFPIVFIVQYLRLKPLMTFLPDVSDIY